MGTNTNTRQTAEPDSNTSDDATNRDVRIIGHRGCADQYPENTLLAVRESAPHVDMIEIDVQRCGSGEIVVFHDDTLQRLTSSTGSVSTTDWNELREMTVLDSDQTIPLLTDVFEALPTDTALNIELKHEGMAERLLELLADIEHDVLLSSFSPTALRELRERDATVPLALVIDDSPDISLSIAADLDCVAINPGYDMVLDTSFVERAHAEGFSVNTWTIDDRETVQRAIDAGVDGVFVDRWDIV